MELTWQTVVAVGAAASALAGLLAAYNRAYRWTLRQREQDQELRAIRR